MTEFKREMLQGYPWSFWCVTTEYDKWYCANGIGETWRNRIKCTGVFGEKALNSMIYVHLIFTKNEEKQEFEMCEKSLIYIFNMAQAIQ